MHKRQSIQFDFLLGSNAHTVGARRGSGELSFLFKNAGPKSFLFFFGLRCECTQSAA